MENKEQDSARNAEQIREEIRRVLNRMIDEEWDALMEEVRQGKKYLKEDFKMEDVQTVLGVVSNNGDEQKDENVE